DVVRYILVGGNASTRFTALAQWSPSRGLVFNGSGLPAVPNDSTYQLWLLSGLGPASVATFVPDASGQISIATTPPPQAPATVTGVLVTLERSGGSTVPSSQVVLRRPPPVDTP